MTTKTSAVRLNTVKRGHWLRIQSIPEGEIRAQFVRLGIHEGTRVRLIERLPGGTVVLGKRRQELAIGHILARQISVLVLHGEEQTP